MDESILEEGKKLLVSYVKGKNINYETLHPWRNSWEFIVLHSLRVEGYVKKIFNGESKDISQDDMLLTRLAAILHDIGRIHRKEGHALLGRDIVRDWLAANQTVANAVKDLDKLLYLIENHSDKKSDESDYCAKVLKDADLLDEIGVMSIFMTSNWFDRNNPYFFNLIHERVGGFEMEFCHKTFKLLKTETAKSVLEEKRKFIELFNNQLKDELYGTEVFGEASIEESYK
jgi:HD superfamily phosphodiesterase